MDPLSKLSSPHWALTLPGQRLACSWGWSNAGLISPQCHTLSNHFWRFMNGKKATYLKCFLRKSVTSVYQKISLKELIFWLEELGPDCGQRTASNFIFFLKEKVRAVVTSEFNIFIYLWRIWPFGTFPHIFLQDEEMCRAGRLLACSCSVHSRVSQRQQESTAIS